MLNNKLSKKDIALLGVIVLTALFSVYRLISAYRLGLINNADHIWIWFDAEMAFRRLDVYKEIAENFYYDGFVVHSEVSAFPWGLILNIFLHGGFLSADKSIWWYRGMRLISFVIMSVCVYRKFGKLHINDWRRYVAFILFIAPWSNISCLTSGNQGQVIVMWIVTAICFIDENDYIAAFFMTIAMIKPHTALPFFALFLMKKKWKIIIPSIIGVCGFWAISAIWMHANPIEQLMGILEFSGNLYWDIHVVGVCDFLRHYFGISDNVAMLLSMVAGIASLVLCASVLLGRRELNVFQLYSIPAIVSIFWCYKSECDYIIVIVVGLAILTMWDSTRLTWHDTFCLIVVFLMLFTKPFSQALLGGWLNMSVYVGYTFDIYMKTVALFIFVIYMNRRCEIIKNKTDES